MVDVPSCAGRKSQVLTQEAVAVSRARGRGERDLKHQAPGLANWPRHEICHDMASDICHRALTLLIQGDQLHCVQGPGVGSTLHISVASQHQPSKYNGSFKKDHAIYIRPGSLTEP